MLTQSCALPEDLACLTMAFGRMKEWITFMRLNQANLDRGAFGGVFWEVLFIFEAFLKHLLVYIYETR